MSCPEGGQALKEAEQDLDLQNEGKAITADGQVGQPATLTDCVSDDGLMLDPFLPARAEVPESYHFVLGEGGTYLSHITSLSECLLLVCQIHLQLEF